MRIVPRYLQKLLNPHPANRCSLGTIDSATLWGIFWQVPGKPYVANATSAIPEYLQLLLHAPLLPHRHEELVSARREQRLPRSPVSSSEKYLAPLLDTPDFKYWRAWVPSLRTAGLQGKGVSRREKLKAVSLASAIASGELSRVVGLEAGGIN